VFPVSRWLAPLRRRMVRTMAGLDRGLVRRPIGLDELRRLALVPGATTHQAHSHATSASHSRPPLA
jgi:hypothetical protein